MARHAVFGYHNGLTVPLLQEFEQPKQPVRIHCPARLHHGVSLRSAHLLRLAALVPPHGKAAVMVHAAVVGVAANAFHIAVAYGVLGFPSKPLVKLLWIIAEKHGVEHVNAVPHVIARKSLFPRFLDKRAIVLVRGIRRVAAVHYSRALALEMQIPRRIAVRKQ